MKFVVKFISMSHKTGEKTFGNVNHVLEYIDKYVIYEIEVRDEDSCEVYTSEEFVERYKE